MNKRRFLTAIFCMLAFIKCSFATHYRAGEIIYQVIAPFTIKATVITYTKESSTAADRDSIQLNWGDGTPVVTILRSNGPLGPSGIPYGELLGNDVKKNIYTATHTYPGAAPPPNNFYIITFNDPNRIASIINIQGGNSVDIPFYIEDTLKFPTDISNIGFNSSPILLNPPIDYANVGDTFYHNPLAYDPDGDSLIFEKIAPLQATGQAVPLYQYPNQIVSTNNNYFLNRHTGEIIWAVPQRSGIYNIAILIIEYRRGVCMGTMIRDMQIIVDDQNNNPPQITAITDTCIRAGDILRIPITATDPNLGQTVTLTADGAPFRFPSSLNPATFSSIDGNPATGIMQWNTLCDHIRKQFYEVVIKAQDDYVAPSGIRLPLVDEHTILIDVVAPPPLNLTAVANTRQVNLDWSNYNCASFNEFRGFSVWRKIGSNPFIPAYCETGLAGRGYTKIADKLTTTDYIDANVIRGQQLCYRVLAHFSKKSPNGFYEYDYVESVPSEEVCVFMPFDVPVITKVSVSNTSTSTGTIDLEWTKPRAGGNSLDTLLFLPPYHFEVFQSQGYSSSSGNSIFVSPSRNSYHDLNDTTFVAQNLNTTDFPNNYSIAFYANADTVGYSDNASSVYLTIQPSDKSLSLNWNYQVPWTQDSFQIFKRNNATFNFDYLATVLQNSYTDTALINDTTYCYFIKAFGHYSASFIYKPLINLSEIKCAAPRDTVSPCPPVLTVANDCDKDVLTNFSNHLSWYNPYDSCSEDIRSYRIYYGTNTGSLHWIDSTANRIDTIFDHLLNNSLAGCYAVTAVDRVGNESAFSNVFCVDNCPIYNLPNTFTPNGDGANDFFTPMKPYRFVSRIDLKIFNRWGDKIFETTNPDILWDGTDQKTKKAVSEGVYLYAGYYWEQRLEGEVRHPLPSKKGGGFIHLIR